MGILTVLNNRNLNEELCIVHLKTLGTWSASRFTANTT